MVHIISLAGRKRPIASTTKSGGRRDPSEAVGSVMSYDRYPTFFNRIEKVGKKGMQARENRGLGAGWELVAMAYESTLVMHVPKG